jgi:hypothetical protein
MKLDEKLKNKLQELKSDRPLLVIIAVICLAVYLVFNEYRLEQIEHEHAKPFAEWK